MLYAAVFFIIVIYFSLFIVRIKAAVRYTRNEQEEWIKFSFYTGRGLIRYENKVPLVKKEDGKVKFKLVKGQAREMKGGSEKNERLGPFDIIKKFDSVRKYLKDHKSLLEDIRRYLNKHDIHAEIKIKLKQGTGDAAQTGVICGLLWNAAGILISYISRHLKITGRDLSIIPCFNKRMFEVDASCIFHVRLVHIIVVLIKIYYMKNKIRIRAKKSLGGEVSG
ncbi:MAG: DUF2953 domain-containing protein [Clostridiaceae bacterium]|nr:DUF2953 domain-containing protein [Clostridiaceae bacterium]